MEAPASSGGLLPSSVSLTGTDPVSQILTGIVMVAILYFVMAAGEYIYGSWYTMYRDRVELFPNTYASGAKVYQAIQNPKNKNSKTVQFSDNQRYGIEFSYAMFCHLTSETFDGEMKLKHILHKGYSRPYPLLGPGIFAWGHKNCLRIYVNCFKTWNNFVEVENIPVDKWFHLVVSVKGSQVYVYINGNIKSKVTTPDATPPYQNYGDVYVFNTRKLILSRTAVPSLADDPALTDSSPNLEFIGSAKGYVSRVFYFGYALTYTEINALMNMGPSNIMEGVDLSISPYLADRWWVDKNA
jgi:hypothetical protein